MQLFCGVLFAENESIKDNSFVSRIRSFLAKHVSIDQIQQKMLEKWKSNLWDKTIPAVCKRFKIKIPRSKFDHQKKKYLIYSKLRRKSRRKTKARKRSLLHLLEKGLESLQQLLNQAQGAKLSATDYVRIRTIKLILQQQRQLFNYPGIKIKDRIVSLAKPYVRPIKRGKENKDIEFGMKVHMNQIDGINVIEYASFNNFNKCKRLKISILKR